MGDSSDEDVPLINRNAMFLANKKATVLVDSDDEQSDLPSWLVNHKSPAKQANGSLAIPMLSSDSDSDLKEVLSPAKLLSPSKKKPNESQQPMDIDNNEPVVLARGKQTNKKQPTPKAKPASAKKTETASQQPKPAIKPIGIIPVASKEVPIVLPDKISQLKMLVELEHDGQLHGATDLSGDSGAIGRFLVRGERIQLDLKGVLYDATLVPAPTSMAIVNIGPTDAKVECFLDDFVQLRQNAEFAEAHRGGQLDGIFNEDEDETYAVDGVDDDGPGTKKKVVKKKPAGGRGGGKAAGAKKPAAKKPRAAGVKKAPAKPRKPAAAKTKK